LPKKVKFYSSKSKGSWSYSPYKYRVYPRDCKRLFRK
jgi:hypothetical protein